MMQYNPYPIGQVPEHLQRPELKQLKETGYSYDDPRDIVGIFENKVADFAGSKYAVATDCCTHAIELALRYQLLIAFIDPAAVIPKNTYVSVYMALKKLGFGIELTNCEWSGYYHLLRTGVIDAAVAWRRGMYIDMSKEFLLGDFVCLSFQIKKRIPIGRGGMILTNSELAYKWLKLASYDGRNLSTPYDDPNHIEMMGCHYYMTPEDAARGILLMDQIKEEGDTANWTNYPDISKMLKL